MNDFKRETEKGNLCSFDLLEVKCDANRQSSNWKTPFDEGWFRSHWETSLSQSQIAKCLEVDRIPIESCLVINSLFGFQVSRERREQ